MVFSPESTQFQKQVHSCHWFLVPELNSRKFLVNQFTELNLSMCGLVRIDESIKDQQRLQKLNLSGNYLTSIQHLPNSIESLNLSNNLIDSVELTDIMVNIKSLDLSFNKINESALPSIHLWFNRLIEINLACNCFNDISEFIQVFSKNFKGLRSL